jgi:hypothetical protein
VAQGESAGEASLATAQQLSSHTRNTLVVNKLQHEYEFAYDLLKECSVEDHARLGAEVEALHAKAKLKGLDFESLTTPAGRSAADDTKATTVIDSSANSLANLFGSGGGMFGQTSFSSSPTANIHPSSATEDPSAATTHSEGGASKDDASDNIKKKAPIAGRRKSTVFAPTQSHQQATNEIQEKQAQRAADGAANKQVTADWMKSAKLWPEKHCLTAATTVTREGAHQPSTVGTTATRYSHNPARSTRPRRPRALSECAERSRQNTESNNTITDATQIAASRNKVKQQSRRHSDTSVERKAAAAGALLSPSSTAHQLAALSPSSVAVSNSTELASTQQPQRGDASDSNDSASSAPAIPEATMSRRQDATYGSRNLSRRHFATAKASPLTSEGSRSSDGDASPLAGSTENIFSKSKPRPLPDMHQQNKGVPCDARNFGPASPATRAVPPRFIAHQQQEPNSDEQIDVASRGSGLPSVSSAVSPPWGHHKNVEPPLSSTSGATTNSATTKNNARSRGGRRASLPSISGATDENSSAPLAIVSPSMRNVPRGRQTGSGTSGMIKGRQQQQVLRIPHANPRLLQL